MSQTTSSAPEDRIPVIVGIGEIVDRPKDIRDGLEPLTLLEQALARAEQDSGGKFLREIGSLDIVNFLSWRYQDPARQLSDRLGITPKHAY
jgi:acetyl-CoA C-acetyltransferase